MFPAWLLKSTKTICVLENGESAVDTSDKFEKRLNGLFLTLLADRRQFFGPNFLAA